MFWLQQQYVVYHGGEGGSLAFKIRQNSFPAGALPQTPLGELTTLP